MMIMLRKPMRLVAHILQEPQCRRMPAQADWLGIAGPIDFFLGLGQRDQARRLLAEHAKHVERRVELALAAVDEQDVGKDALDSAMPGRGMPKAPRDHFAYRREVIDLIDRFDAITSIARLERQAIDKS